MRNNKEAENLTATSKEVLFTGEELQVLQLVRDHQLSAQDVKSFAQLLTCFKPQELAYCIMHLALRAKPCEEDKKLEQLQDQVEALHDFFNKLRTNE